MRCGRRPVSSDVTEKGIKSVYRIVPRGESWGYRVRVVLTVGAMAIYLLRIECTMCAVVSQEADKLYKSL